MLISSAQARSTCASGLSACDGLPFCCPTSSKCLALAGNSTVLCCPEGSACAKIQPITCDLAEQDAAKFPSAPIKTTVTNVKLPVCGNLCCPFGYSCSGSGCTKDVDQSKIPGASTTTTATATATATTTLASAVSATHAATSAGTTSTAPAGAGPEKISIIAGAIGGAFALILIVVLIVFCMRSRKGGVSEKSVDKDSSSSTGPYGNISGPIMDPSSCRTDFIRKSPRASERYSIPNPFNSPDESAFADDARSSFVSTHEPARMGNVARLPPIRAMKASSKYSARVQREPSSESINVFADPNTVNNGDRCTLFSDIMAEANMRDVERSGYVRHVPGTTPKI